MRRRRLGTPPRPIVTLLLLGVTALISTPRLGYGDNAGVGYHGGPLLDSTSSYAIFWLPPDRRYGVAPGTTDGYERLVERYLSDVGGTDLYGVLTEYAVPPGEPVSNRSSLAGSWIDAQAYPRSADASDPLTEQDLRNEIERAMRVNNWPAGRTSVFYVFLGADVQACRDVGASAGCTFTREAPQCGWHSLFWAGDQPVVYAVLPEAWEIPGCLAPGGQIHAPNGDPAADAEVSFLSHEQFELVTDPEGNGWHDGENREIADLCQQDYGLEGGNASNVELGGHLYWLQREWSNRLQACVLSGEPGQVTPGPPSSTATPQPTAGSDGGPTPEPIAVATPPATPPGPATTATRTPGTQVRREGCRKGYRLVRGKCKPRRKKGGG